MGHRWLYICAIISAVTVCRARDRVRVIFVNNAPEDVYVTISNTPVVPGNKHCVPTGTRKYIFALEFSEENPLYVTVSSMSYNLQYTLVIHGSLVKTSMRACRAYGDIQLLRHNQRMDTIGATNLAQGFILSYSHEYELTLKRIGQQERPHDPMHHSARMRTSNCCR